MQNNITPKKAIVIGLVAGILLAEAALAYLYTLSNIDSPNDSHLVVGICIIASASFINNGYLIITEIISIEPVEQKILCILLILITQGLIGGISGYLLVKIGSKEYSVVWLMIRVAIILMIIGAVSLIFLSHPLSTKLDDGWPSNNKRLMDNNGIFTGY